MKFWLGLSGCLALAASGVALTMVEESPPAAGQEQAGQEPSGQDQAAAPAGPRPGPT